MLRRAVRRDPGRGRGRTSGFSEPTLTNVAEGMLYGLILGTIPSLIVGILCGLACPKDVPRAERIGTFVLCALPVFPRSATSACSAAAAELRCLGLERAWESPVHWSLHVFIDAPRSAGRTTGGSAPAAVKPRPCLARTDVWFASFEASGGLSTWFGRDESPQGKRDSRTTARGGWAMPSRFRGSRCRSFLTRTRPSTGAFRAMFRRGSWSESDILDASVHGGRHDGPAGGPFQSRFRMWEAAFGGIGGLRPRGFRGKCGAGPVARSISSASGLKTPSGALTDGAGGP
jgi:hypothetical protein